VEGDGYQGAGAGLVVASSRRKTRSQPVAHWEFQPVADFHDRENRRKLESDLWTADVYPVLFEPRA
jgi:hypothetical protein